MVRPGPSRDGISGADLGSLAPGERHARGAPRRRSGPGRGRRTGPDGPERPQRGWIDPDDRLWRHPSEVAARRRRPGAPQRAAAGTPTAARVMALVGAAAVMAPSWPSSSSCSLPPPITRSTGGAHAATRWPPAPSPPWPDRRTRCRAVRPGRRPRHGGAAGHHGARHGRRSSASPWPRVAWSSPRPMCCAAPPHLDVVGPGGEARMPPPRGDGRRLGRGPGRRARGRARGALLRRRQPERGRTGPRAQLRPGGRHRVALHCTPGSVTGVGAAIATGPARACPPSPRRWPRRPAVAAARRCSPRGQRRRHPLRPAGGRPRPTPPSSPASSSSGWPTTCARATDAWQGGWVSGHRRPGDAGATVETVQPAEPPAAGSCNPARSSGRGRARPCAPWPSCGPASTSFLPGTAVTLSLRQAQGRPPRPWPSPSAGPPSMRG